MNEIERQILKSNAFALFVTDIEQRRKALWEYLQDKNIPFADRKEVWKKTPDFLRTTYPWLPTFTSFEKKWGDIDWSEESYSRHAEVDLREFITRDIFENNKEKLTDFIESVIEEKMHAFVFDW